MEYLAKYQLFRKKNENKIFLKSRFAYEKIIFALFLSPIKSKIVPALRPVS